jgi:HlyD family secretion protein
MTSKPGVPIITAKGELEAFREIKISPEVSGEIIELPVEEGQQVRKGDLLLKIKSDFYVANRDQAEGNYKSAAASLAMANARLEGADAELKRNQSLYRSGLLSESAFDEARIADEIARAQSTNAEGQLEMARASLARAQYELDKTTIFSPITGTITRLNSQVGERVVGTATMAGTEVITLADLNDMEAKVEVGEGEVGAIACAQKVKLEMNAFPRQAFEGTVTGVATSSDGFGSHNETGVREAARFEVRIRLKKTQAFRPGMSVTAKIPVLPVTPALAGPTSAVKTSG